MELDLFLRDLSRGIGRIQNGQVPDGSGDTIPVGQNGTLDDYLYLPGRAGGQRVRSVDTAPTVQIDSGTTPLSADGAIGDAALRLNHGTTGLVDFRPYRFSSTSTELVLTSSLSTAGIPVNFLSDDGTSALRIASTTNRTFLQCGLKNAAGNTINANITFGASGARVASSWATEFQRMTFSNSAAILADGSGTAVAKTTRMGINIRVDEYASSADANKAKSLHVGDHQASATPTWPAATDPAPLIIENAGDVSGRRLLELRGVSTGSSPTKQIADPQIGFRAALTGSDNSLNGSLLLFNSGSLCASITSAGSSAGTTGRLTFRDASNNNTWQFDRFSSWTGGATTSSFIESGDNAMLCTTGGTPITRLGLSVTSAVMGPRNPSSMPLPTSSRILTVVDSSANVLAYIGPTGGTLFQPSADVNGFFFDGNNISSQIPFNIAAGGTDVFQVGPTGLVNMVSMVLHANTIGSGSDVTFDASTAITASRTYILPDADGTLVLHNNSQALTNKSIQSGTVALTGQTAGVGPNNITVTPNSTNVYMVEVFAMCTTLSGSGAPTLDVTIGWTDTVGATTLTLAAGNDNSLFPLSLAATGRAYGRVLLRRSSGNITYTTVINAASGSPQYALYIRVLNLG